KRGAGRGGARGCGASMEPRLLSRGNPWVYSAWLPADGASMEPRLLSRGNAEDRRPRPGSDHCFNGATASQPWKRAPFTPLTPLHSRLQWSHGFSAVETAWYGTRM